MDEGPIHEVAITEGEPLSNCPSFHGQFVGALIYGFVFNFGSVIVPNWQDVFAFLLLMAVLLIRPWGLFGKPEQEGH